MNLPPEVLSRLRSLFLYLHHMDLDELDRYLAETRCVILREKEARRAIASARISSQFQAKN
ncbi:MAG: hypothetical protein F6K28_46750 [Microcoleus sp. SIO2G3]|nr:hypothetical protein [Microcoleus sp. SIO2G3]